jgi:YbbR domain-containing protein
MEKLVREIAEKFVRPMMESFSSFPRPTKNWMLKALSLFFALFLWYFVVGEDKVDMNVTIPVEIVNLPRDLVISNQFKKQLEVTVSGQRSLIRGMADQHISRTIDLSKTDPGTVVIQNTPDSIPLPRGLSILRVQPPTLTLLLDRLIKKKLPIKPVLTGKVHNGFMLDSVTVDPPTLEISGPQSILAQEQNLKTGPVDITNLDQSTDKQVSLALKSEIADLIGEPVVAVRLNIVELKREIVISDIPVDLETDKGRQSEVIYQLQPSTIKITAEIPQSMLQTTNNFRSLFRAVVFPEALLPGSMELRVEVESPPEANVLSIKPETVTLKINETRPLKIKP